MYRTRQTATLAVVLIVSLRKHVNEGLLMDEQQWHSRAVIILWFPYSKEINPHCVSASEATLLGWMPSSNQFCSLTQHKYWNKGVTPSSAAVLLMFFSWEFTHLPSICHTACKWCQGWVFSLAVLCLPRVLEHYNWTVGFKENMKLVVTHYVIK